MNYIRNISVPAVIAILLALSDQMADGSDEKIITYVDHVRPILQQYCLKCHGNDEQNADLNLQSYATLMAGGSAGAVVKAGQPGASILFQAITNNDEAARMPPKSPPLPSEKIAIINPPSGNIIFDVKVSSKSKNVIPKSFASESKLNENSVPSPINHVKKPILYVASILSNENLSIK